MSRNNFKLKSPMKIDPVPRYEVPFTPDNISDDSGLVAKANKNGTMIVNKNIPKGSPLRKEAEAHEDHHLKDMMDGKLDYDDNAVYHNFDGKGVKMVKRGTFQESDKNLAWEKDAYKAGDNLEEKDMRPNPNKLDEVPNMYEQDTPMAFIKQMGRTRREADQDKVSMSERFGTAMVKKFGCGPQANVEVSKGTDISGNVVDPELKEGKTTTTKRTTSEKGDDGLLVFKEFTKSTTPSRGFKNKEESDWAKNNPEAYRKLIEQKREEESMRQFKQIPIRENPITVDSEPPELKTIEQNKDCEDGYRWSARLGQCVKVTKKPKYGKNKSKGRVKKTKFKHKGNTFSCPKF